MNLTGFPNALSYGALTERIADLKARAANARTELVTGRIADLPAHLRSETGAAQLLRKSIDDITLFRSSVTSALGRAAATQHALMQVSLDTSDISADMLAANGRGDETALGIGAADARAALNAAIAAMNQSFEGKALFSGDAVDRAPFADADALIADISALHASAADATQFEADLDLYFNDPAGGFATTFYQGGTGPAPRLEISNGELVDVSARGDEPAVRDLLRGLSVLAVAGQTAPSPDRDTTLSNAAARLLGAVDGIADIRARIGVAEERSADAEIRLDHEEAALSAVYNEKTARDPYEAATALQELESQLDASYLMTARISQLSLVNYLR